MKPGEQVVSAIWSVYDVKQDTLHNHPGEAIPIPSSAQIGDLQVARTSKAEVNFIVARDGLIIHTPPKDYYRTGYYREQSTGAAVRRWRGDDHLLKYDLKHGFVDAWIPWTEKENVQIVCDYINGTGSWEDYAKKLEL